MENLLWESLAKSGPVVALAGIIVYILWREWRKERAQDQERLDKFYSRQSEANKLVADILLQVSQRYQEYNDRSVVEYETLVKKTMDFLQVMTKENQIVISGIQSSVDNLTSTIERLLEHLAVLDKLTRISENIEELKTK